MRNKMNHVQFKSASSVTPKLLVGGLLALCAAGTLAGWTSEAHAAFVTENLYSAGVTNVGTEITSLAPGNYTFGGVNFDLSGGNYSPPYGLSGGNNAVSRPCSKYVRPRSWFMTLRK